MVPAGQPDSPSVDQQLVKEELPVIELTNLLMQCDV